MRTTARGSASASRTAPLGSARLGSARLGSARLGSARLGVKPGNRYASRHSRGRRCSKVIHELSRVPPVPPERFPLRNDDAHPLTTHANHPRKSTKSLISYPMSAAVASVVARSRLRRRHTCPPSCRARARSAAVFRSLLVPPAAARHPPAHIATRPANTLQDGCVWRERRRLRCDVS